MRIRRTSSVVLALVSALTFLAAACTGGEPGSHPRAATLLEPDEGLQAELEEQQEGTEQRLEALEAAREAGTLGVTEPVVRRPAPGWAGEQIVHEAADDWEPAVATDPVEPFVYILHNRYGDPACSRNCPDPAMILHISRDGGRTWRPERYLCECRGVKAQYDPLIEVVHDSGVVYAVWMNRFHISFSSSEDHGRTWSKPVWIHQDVPWGDKPNMAVSPDGRDVYVLFNGPSGGDAYAAVSHDAGLTWSTVRITDGDRYYYDYGGVALPDGRVVFSHISFTYSGPGDSAEGTIQIHVISSDDAGATWSDQVVDELQLGTVCPSRGCYIDFYDSGPVLAEDAVGNLVIVYNGASRHFGPQTLYSRSSTDGGRTWSDRAAISERGVNAAFPAAIGDGEDGARMWFMDQRTGRWNVWYTTTTDLGATWSAPARISDATSGTDYKDRRGFTEAYGDYGEIAITSAGKTIAVWGEGPSYRGPGGVWFNRER